MIAPGTVACVTGAWGMVGSAIVSQLLAAGVTVRGLSRRQRPNRPGLTCHVGDLADSETLSAFVTGADLVFHCAGELRDESRMREVNVQGTRRLMAAVKHAGIENICHLSSAGVVGRTQSRWVDEQSPCNPQNRYESTKWEAETIVAAGAGGCPGVILRPTNVIDDAHPGALGLAASLRNRLTVALKGGECAHIVHAEDVAAAAVYLTGAGERRSGCYFVSCDDEPLNTFAGLWAMVAAARKGLPIAGVRPAAHLPVIFPYLLRRMLKGGGNRGDVRYSARHLLATGFVFKVGVVEAVDRIAGGSAARMPL